MHDDDLKQVLDGMKLLAIVRRLAESTPLERIGSSGTIHCMYCRKLDDHHATDCLWRNAREVLDAQA